MLDPGGAEPVTDARRLVTRTWTRTVSASSSLMASTHSGCAAVHVPGRSSWRGSAGYDTTRTCRTAATGRHAVALPAATVPGTLTLSAYAGADPTSPRSTAAFSVLRPSGSAASTATASATVGQHAARSVAASQVLRPGRVVQWSVSTSGGHRYDVRSFTVGYTYRVLS